MSAGLPGPVRLLEVLKRVERNHPYSESAPLQLEGRVLADSAELWARLLSAPAEQLRRYVEALSRLELTLLATSGVIRIGNSRCRAILAMAYEYSRDEQIGSLLWESFLIQPEDESLRSLCRDIAHRDRPRLWRELAIAENPAETAADAFLRQPTDFERWFASESVQLAAYTRFLRLVQGLLVEPPLLLSTDRRLSAATIDQWASTAIPPHDRVSWQKRYLEATCGHPRSPEHAVLDRIVKEHRLPDSGEDFWEDVSAAARSDVERWFKDRQLTDLLGEGDRVQFWRAFLPEIVSLVASRDRQVVFVVFDKWFAAQFVNSGVATYLFPRSLLSTLRRQSQWLRIARHVLDLRARALGRYEQRGDFWQWGAGSEVRRVMIEVEA